jgi:hypothetical protein
VGAYKPYLWEQSTFTKGPMFRDWLLTKAKSLHFKTKTTFIVGFNYFFNYFKEDRKRNNLMIRRGRGWGRSQIIRRQESLVLY